MCVVDMPSVALGYLNKSETDRMNLDLVLDGVVDDRIEAAYAIVELGERESRKDTEFPLVEEEDLDVDETEQYHQVPRSPECRREGRRGVCHRSADACQLKSAGNTIEIHLPKIVHVKGAVMPTRTVGSPVQKLSMKRRHDDEPVGDGIKAKLARMLIERKCSQEEAGKLSPNYAVGLKGDDGNDSEEEQSTGRFVRTSAPVLQPNVISHIQSAANVRNSFKNLEVKTEQSVSAEEINRLRSSLQERGIIEQVVLLQGNDCRYKIFPSGVSALENSSDFKLNEISLDHKICSSEVSSKDNYLSSSLFCAQDSSVPEKDGTVHSSTSGKAGDVIKSEIDVPSVRDGQCSRFRSANHSTSTLGTAGMLQYYMLPVIKSLPNSINSEFRGIEVAEGSSIDALKRLEQFSLGKGYGEPVWKKDLAAKRYCQIYGSLNSVSQSYGVSDSPVSEPGHPLSGLIESLSLQNLSSHQKNLSELTNSHRQHHLLKPDSVLEPKKHRSFKSGLGNCVIPKVEAEMSQKSKIMAIVDALEMVKGGEFGSLRTIRNLYTRMMKSRNAANSSAYLQKNTQRSECPIKTEYQPLRFKEQEQESPLDLSHCRRRTCQPIDLKVELKLCSSDQQSPEARTSTDLCKKEYCDLYSDVTPENHTMHSNILPVKLDTIVSLGSDRAAIELTNDKTNSQRPCGSFSYSVPNSHLPPKKRKFRLASQNSGFTENGTSSAELTAPHQGVPNDPNSCTYQTSTTVEGHQILPGRKVSETDSKLLPDVIADDESILSAVAVRDEDGDLPLHIAVAQGSVEIVRKLLPAMSKVGISVDSCNNNRQTALHLAVISNQAQVVELLLDASASANICDRKGNTAVHLAVKYKTLLCLKKILEYSRIPLDLDARNYEGLTALHIGVQLSQSEAVNALLIGGANPNATDGTNGRTPLFNAVEANDFAIATALVQHGSDPYVASYSGCTPLQIATGKSLREMISILEKSGKEWMRRIIDNS